MLFKNAMALETSARIQAMVMDKTGTLTKGEPEITDIITDGIAEGELLALSSSGRWVRAAARSARCDRT